MNRGDILALRIAGTINLRAVYMSSEYVTIPHAPSPVLLFRFRIARTSPLLGSRKFKKSPVLQKLRQLNGRWWCYDNFLYREFLATDFSVTKNITESLRHQHAWAVIRDFRVAATLRTIFLPELVPPIMKYKKKVELDSRCPVWQHGIARIDLFSDPHITPTAKP